MSGINQNIPPVSASGVCGISNASGVYTYYASLTAAMAAAVSGQTIEIFADIVETGAVTIVLKAGVTINGNGHTYTLSNAGTSDVFQTTVAGVYRMYNLNVTRTNATDGYILRAMNYVVSLHYFDNSYFITNKGGIRSESANVIQRFYNANITVTGNMTAFSLFQDAECYNFTLRGTSTCTATLGGGIFYNSVFSHEGNALCASNINAYGCTFIARGGGHTITNGININNCSLYNFTNFGNYVGCVNFNNCLIYSAASYGSYTEATTYFRNCVIISAGNIAAVSGNYYNCTIEALTNYGAYVGLNHKLDGCAVQSRWNNVAGHATTVADASAQIIGCVIQVNNTSANAIYASSALTMKYANNAFRGATTPVNANITQGVTNTHDNQGNILI